MSSHRLAQPVGDGMDSKRPFSSLKDSSVDQRILRQLEFLEFKQMTRIQAEAIPALTESADLDGLVCSETGSGKTMVFLIPILSRILEIETRMRAKLSADGKVSLKKGQVLKRSDGTRALIISPTRELAQQTLETAQKLSQMLPYIICGALLSGTNRKSEKAQLRKGITILIATPGKILDHLDGTSSFSFSRLSTVVLDEADRLLDLGFEVKLHLIIKELRNNAKNHGAEARLKADLLRQQLKDEAESTDIVITKDTLAAEREAQRQIARQLLKEAGISNAPGPVNINKIFSTFEADEKKKATTIMELDSTDDESSPGVADSKEKQSLEESPSDAVQPSKSIATADCDQHEPDHQDFQTIMVSATLRPDVVQLAKFCLRPNHKWFRGAETDDSSNAEGEDAVDKENKKVDFVIPKSLKQAFIKVSNLKARLLTLFAMLKMSSQTKKSKVGISSICTLISICSPWSSSTIVRWSSFFAL